MFEVLVTERFEARHQLRMPDGELEPLHQHDWRLTVAVRAPELDEHGLVVDFGVVKAAIDSARAPLAGRTLNLLPLFAGRNPSAERVAVYFAERLAAALPEGTELAWVEVEEEPGCVARYLPPAT